MKISVFGLGYVGTISAACLARDGHRVVGCDIVSAKAEALNAGRPLIYEPGLDSVVATAVAAGRLRATTAVGECVAETEMALICVGTPSDEAGRLNTAHVRQVCEQIGEALRERTGPFTVVVRSTVLPGTTGGVLVPLLEERSGRKCGEDLRVCFNPEFLREATAMEDYDDPPKVVVGCDEPVGAQQVASLYAHLEAPLFRTSLRAAEMVKYLDNVFHALKITFANEVGAIAQAVGVDSHQVMRIFCADRKLNISEHYLWPGFAFGGSCLPKDLRALVSQAQELGLSVPLLQSIAASNGEQIVRARELVLSATPGLDRPPRIAVLGLAFKAGTDDVRESPSVALCQELLGAGCAVRVYDSRIHPERQLGAMKAYVEQHLPQLPELLVADGLALLEWADVAVIATTEAEFRALLDDVTARPVVVDLVRLFRDRRSGNGYYGLSW